MKRYKKLTAMLLSAVMAFSVMSFTAFAEEETDNVETSEEDRELEDINANEYMTFYNENEVIEEDENEESLNELETVNEIKGPSDGVIFNNVVFANGKDVTVEPDSSNDGLIVTIDETEYTYEHNNTSNKEGALVIFAGGNNDSETHGETTIRIKSGAMVNTIFGGGYNNSTVDKAEIFIEEGAIVTNVYGGGMTEAKDSTSKDRVESVDITVDGKVGLLYAGGNSAVGPKITDVIDFERGTANNSVGQANITINGEVVDYFGSSYSYGGIESVVCTVNGEISGSYSAVSGANGYTGSAAMIVNEGASVNTDLYMAMRGYIAGDITLENHGSIERVSLNPDGVEVSVAGNVEVISDGTIENCNIDCGCAKKTVKEGVPAYPAKITVSGDVEVTSAYWESNTGSNYEAVNGQTIYLKDGAVLKEAGTLDNVIIVAEEVGDTTVTVEPDEPKIDAGNVQLPDGFGDEQIKGTTVEGLENSASGIVTESEVEKAKSELSKQIEAGNDLIIEVKPYLDIKVVDYNETDKSFTVDITPKCDVVAKAGDGEVQLGTKDMTISEVVTVTIPVPENVFEEENLYVKHRHGSNTYYYEAELEDNKVTFDNPNGFSEITILNDNRVATIDYKELDKEVEYTRADIGKDLKDYNEKGYTFNGWEINGKTYTVMTEELFEIIDGGKVTAKADLTKKKSSGSSYSLEEGHTDRDENTTTEPEKEESPYEDVGKDNPYYDAIVYVTEKGWMSGISTENKVFAPNGTLTRAMGVMVLWNKAGQPEPQEVAPFLDVTSDAWYAKAVAWAYEQGISVGYGDIYGPNDYLTTEQFTRMNDIANGRTPAVYIGGAPNATRGWVAAEISK